jgi:hypothetical protein
VDEDIKSTWNMHWKTMNDEFENILSSLKDHLRGRVFHVWDGNHQFKA